MNLKKIEINGEQKNILLTYNMPLYDEDGNHVMDREYTELIENGDVSGLKDSLGDNLGQSIADQYWS